MEEHINPSPAVLTTAHHRMDVASSTRCLAWWSGLSSCTSHHLHGSSSKHCIHLVITVWTYACFMRVFRGTRITPTIKPHGACRRLPGVMEDASHHDNSMETCRGMQKDIACRRRSLDT